jgi:hypothetical protein
MIKTLMLCFSFPQLRGEMVDVRLSQIIMYVDNLHAIGVPIAWRNILFFQNRFDQLFQMKVR